jgi:hypothetical protein
VRIPHLKCPKDATSDEQRIVAAFNLGKVSKVRLRGVVHAAADIPDPKTIPQGLSSARLGRMPWGAPFLEDGRGARYVASVELGCTFVKEVKPVLRQALGGLSFGPKPLKPTQPMSTNGRITTQSVMETAYTHAAVTMDDVARVLREVLNAPLEQLQGGEGVKIAEGKTLRIAKGALERVVHNGKLLAFSGVTSARYRRLANGLNVPTEFSDSLGGFVYSLIYKVPNALTITMFGDGKRAEAKLVDFVTRIARWIVMDHALRVMTSYPSSVVSSLYTGTAKGFRCEEEIQIGCKVVKGVWDTTEMSQRDVVPSLGQLCALIDPDNLLTIHNAFLTRSMSVMSNPAEAFTSATLNHKYNDIRAFAKRCR